MPRHTSFLQVPVIVLHEYSATHVADYLYLHTGTYLQIVHMGGKELLTRCLVDEYSPTSIIQTSLANSKISVFGDKQKVWITEILYLPYG